MGNEGAIEEIKNRLDILEVVSGYLPLKKAGQNWRGLCPFHSEKTPSFMVNPSKQIFHCFGCGTGGDVIGFVMKYENLTFGETLRLLAKKAGVRLGEEYYRDSGEKETLKEIHSEALKFFRENLRGSTVASAYIEARGIRPETAEEFSLGYAGKGGLLERLKGKGHKEALILKSGLVSSGQRGLYDTFRERIIFPIFDAHGDAVAFGGRVMGDAMPKYLNSPDTPLFKKGETLYALHRAADELRKKDCAMVVEGYFDAIMCHQAGFKNTVAPLGTALTEGHLKKLARYTHNIVLVFDGDSAGASAAKRSLPILMEQGLSPRILLLPQGHDPDSLLRAEGAERFQTLLLEAVSPVEFVLKDSGRPLPPSRGKTETVREALSLIALVKDPIMKELLVSELSDRAKIREAVLRGEMKKSLSARAAGKQGEGEAKTAAPRPRNEEVMLLSVIVSMPEKADKVLSEISLNDIKDDKLRKAFQTIALSGSDGGTEEEQALLRRLVIRPGFDPAEADRIIEDCIRRIKKRKIDGWITDASAGGDFGLLNRLVAERKKLLEGTG